MPIFRFSEAFGVGRDVKVFLDLQSGLTRGAVPDLERYEEQVEKLKNAQQWISEHKETLESKNREILRLESELRVAEERVDLGSVVRDEVPDLERYTEQAEELRNAWRRIKEQKKALKSKDREIFRLENELRTAKERVENGQAVKKGSGLPVFRFSKALGVGRGAKLFLNLQGGLTRGAAPGLERYEEQAGKLKNAQRWMKEQKEELRGKDREISRLKNELRAVKERVGLGSGLVRDEVPDVERYEEQAEKLRDAQRWIRVQEEELRGKDREISRLENTLRAVQERAATTEQAGPETGTLPDFVIIGAGKCGTTSLYDLLTRHPHVERAALKELHYFDYNFDKSTEWYRSQFPSPRWKDGRRIITGEASPYLSHPPVPERMAKVVPQARLIVLLRNPVDRVYSLYHREIRHGRETRSFEEAIETSEYLTDSIYVDQLLRWSEFFDEEQMLVLKSEDFFQREPDVLKLVLEFLGLPDWEPGRTSKVRNKGRYEQEMDPSIRKRLEDFFEPHNRRLYEYLGVDFGW